MDKHEGASSSLAHMVQNFGYMPANVHSHHMKRNAVIFFLSYICACVLRNNGLSKTRSP